MDFAKLRNVVVGLAIGVVAGIGGYTFIYARGYSYMTDDPQACVNCHVMREQYDGWINSSHRSVATCNDCHTPAGAVGKYVTKARNGFWHSFYFTTGRFPEPIRITGHNREVAEQSCRKCHSELTESIEGPHRQAGASSCLRCHDTVGHRTRK
ncbi:MAG TPA: cytochrome c nitrite reductase small subunit [Pyrinomonadaceae bacterium]|nr:cytochrome c nitrite reductase small subunit [Pyrinomonadaceae bacterium]